MTLHSSKKSLIKSAGVVASATLVSRILGFIRDIIIARLFGTGVSAQAFVVAFRIPNLLRDLVGEGATNAAVVPVLSEYSSSNSKKEFWELVGIFANCLFIILVIISMLGVLFSPLIIRIIAPGFCADKIKFDLTVRLTQIMFPYILFIGLTALFIGALNTIGHFWTPAFGPCLLNLSVIAASVWLVPYFSEGSFGLAVGVIIGGIAQLVFQLPVLYRKGMRTIFSKAEFKHPKVKEVARLLFPRMLGSAVYQFSIFVDTIVASLSKIVGDGGVAAIYYSNRLIQFPMAIFGLSMAMVSLPAMSRQTAANDISKLKETISFALRSIFLVMLPASVGLIVLGKPITEFLFKRGAFDAYSVSITSYCLVLYSVGLTSYGGVKIISSAFYSLKDTVTPLKVSGACLILNLILNLILMWPLKIGGLALATSISATLNLAMLFIILRKRIGIIDDNRIRASFIRISGASVLMGIVTRLVWLNSSDVIVSILVSIIAYAGFCLIFRVKELSQFLRWILKRG